MKNVKIGDESLSTILGGLSTVVTLLGVGINYYANKVDARIEDAKIKSTVTEEVAKQLELIDKKGA